MPKLVPVKCPVCRQMWEVRPAIARDTDGTVICSTRCNKDAKKWMKISIKTKHIGEEETEDG